MASALLFHTLSAERRPFRFFLAVRRYAARVDITQVEALARELMQIHGVDDWEFRFDRARRRAGLTNHRHRRISLSRHLMALYDESEVRETILHEIAHARVGAAHGHDAVWAAEARRVGASGRRLVSSQAPTIPGRWVGTCPAGHTVTRMRRPTVPVSCARCCRRFDPHALVTWSYDGVMLTPAEIGPRYARAVASLTSDARRAKAAQ